MAKSFEIPKQLVWEAYLRVKANRGAAGVDEQSIEEFEEDVKGNLYRIWNRMSSGSYFPPPVRGVPIPKKSGGTRMLGVPTVSDRIAQMVVKLWLEPLLEPSFHQNSYGYRPGKSAHDAVAITRQRCWRYDWVVPPRGRLLAGSKRGIRLSFARNRSRIRTITILPPFSPA